MEKYPLSVLIVEDDPPSRLITQTIVKLIFEKVHIAENGLEGFDLFEKNNPDIVLSDIGMPFLDGLGMSKKIREINSKVPIVLATAFDDKNLLLNAIELGINHYIIKPINRDKLIEVLSKIADDLLLQIEFKKQQDKIRQLYLAIEHSSGLVIIFDKDRKINYFNPKLAELSEYYPNELKDKDIDSLLFGDNQISFLNAIKEQIEWRGELNLKNKSNKELVLFASLSPIFTFNGNIDSFILVADDITEKKIIENKLKEYNELLENKVRQRTSELEKINKKLLEEIEIRKKTEVELIKAKDAAEEASRAKSLFLAKVTHELRTPMNGILGMTSVLLDTNLTEKQKRSLLIVKQSGETLLNIINDILDWSKIETGKLKLELYKFNLIDLIKNVVELLDYSAKNKGIELKLNLSNDLPKIVFGDGHRLQQIFVNLISNAIKFTEKGFVEISAKKLKVEDNKTIIQFAIKDTGIGIPKEKMDRLFKSFSQIDDNLTRKYGGTGLGLFISKELVEMMDGEIFCESEVGIGSVFYFTIPFELPNDDLLPINEEFSLAQIASKYKNLNLRILVAEDSYINQEIIKEALDSINCVYQISKNGAEAFEIFTKERFDAILMDLQMPEMDGFEAATAIIKYERSKNITHTPIIALTAHDDNDSIEKVYAIGMDDLITKPFNWKNFFETLSKYKKTDNEKLLDLDFFIQSINNNKILYKKLIKYFIENVPNQIENLETEIKNKNFARIEKISHKLKSEIGNFGAQKAYNLITKINQQSRLQKLEKIDELFEELKIELKKVLQYLEQNIENDNIN